MEIIKETTLTESTKEKLPLSFLTDFISRGWDDIGYLKETIKSIKESFSGTKKVEELLQALVDAYLVCIGQMELHVQAKDYLDIDIDKDLKEDLVINVADNGDIQIKADPDVVVNVDQNEEVCAGQECDIPPVKADIEPVVEPAEEPIAADDGEFNTPFEFDAPAVDDVRQFKKPDVSDFFVDFDEPVGEPVTEKELYGDGEDAIDDEKIVDDAYELDNKAE